MLQNTNKPPVMAAFQRKSNPDMCLNLWDWGAWNNWICLLPPLTFWGSKSLHCLFRNRPTEKSFMCVWWVFCRHCISRALHRGEKALWKWMTLLLLLLILAWRLKGEEIALRNTPPPWGLADAFVLRAAPLLYAGENIWHSCHRWVPAVLISCCTWLHYLLVFINIPNQCRAPCQTESECQRQLYFRSVVCKHINASTDGGMVNKLKHFWPTQGCQPRASFFTWEVILIISWQNLLQEISTQARLPCRVIARRKHLTTNCFCCAL